jgi:hypothetical protein
MVKTKASPSLRQHRDFIDPIQYTLRIGPAADAGPDQTFAPGFHQRLSTAWSGQPRHLPHSSTAWSVINGEVTIDSPSSLDTVARLTSATATLRLTAVQANGCVVTDDVLLTVAALPPAEIAGPSTVNPSVPKLNFNSMGLRE